MEGCEKKNRSRGRLLSTKKRPADPNRQSCRNIAENCICASARLPRFLPSRRPCLSFCWGLAPLKTAFCYGRGLGMVRRPPQTAPRLRSLAPMRPAVDDRPHRAIAEAVAARCAAVPSQRRRKGALPKYERPSAIGPAAGSPLDEVGEQRYSPSYILRTLAAIPRGLRPVSGSSAEVDGPPIPSDNPPMYPSSAHLCRHVLSRTGLEPASVHQSGSLCTNPGERLDSRRFLGVVHSHRSGQGNTMTARSDLVRERPSRKRPPSLRVVRTILGVKAHKR